VVEGEFSAFVRAHTSALLRSAFLLTSDAAAAEDLVQETFLRLYPKWSRVARVEAPLAYVRRSMLNTFLNSRRTKSSQEQPIAEIPDRPDESDLACDVTERALVVWLLESLPPRQRAVLVLGFLHDLSDAEIAADLGCRRATVRSIVSRALASVRSETTRRAWSQAAAQRNGTPR
jgi:RNA polymerase sigma-70 factor (sigma-E family)